MASPTFRRVRFGLRSRRASAWILTSLTPHGRCSAFCPDASIWRTLFAGSRPVVGHDVVRTVERMVSDAHFDIEQQLWAEGARVIAACDEVGRGSLAADLRVGAVVVVPGTVLLPGLRDSKMLSAKRRAALVPDIHAWAAGHGVGIVAAAVIDELGMAAALRLGVSLALSAASTSAGRVIDTVIVDGPVNLAGDGYRVHAQAKADSESATCAAASILAKESRDTHMLDLDARFPEYGFAKHKGYGTAAHYAAIDAHGLTPEHRRSFKLKGQ
jgi:ribonuclease HII